MNAGSDNDVLVDWLRLDNNRALPGRADAFGGDFVPIGCVNLNPCRADLPGANAGGGYLMPIGWLNLDARRAD